MTTCLRKSCSPCLGLLFYCEFYQFVCVCMCVCASFSFGFEGEMWDLLVLIPDHCLSFSFSSSTFSYFYDQAN